MKRAQKLTDLEEPKMDKFIGHQMQVSSIPCTAIAAQTLHPIIYFFLSD
jgi:hypothetical protein